MGDKIQSLRIASYNIRKAIGLDRKRDPGRILDVINNLDADLVALQEADRRLGSRRAALPHDMIAHHTDFEVVPVATNDISVGWHGNAILRRKTVPVSSPVRLDLPGLEPRGAVRVRIELERPIDVIATHLGLARRHRKAQLRKLRGALDEDATAIVLGDFNEWSPTRGLEALDGLHIHAPGTTYHAARPVAALDRIAVTPDIKVRDAGVSQTRLSRRASDHLPIWADVSFRTSL